MEILFSFLNWVSSFSHVDEESGSKMDIHNLATVITPNILYSHSKNSGMDDSFLAIEAVYSLIECNEAMCEVGLPKFSSSYAMDQWLLMFTFQCSKQVPEDLQSILNDSTLFNGSADITTKEILKRYGDIARFPGPQRTVTNADSLSSHGKEGRGNVPIATRIDTDPYQATAWQKESSVRHVQGPGVSTTYPSSSQNTPPQQTHFEFSNPNSPYRQRAGSVSVDSQGSPVGGGVGANRNSQYSISGWSKQGHQQQGHNELGVTGGD